MVVHRKLENIKSQNVRFYYYWEHYMSANKEVSKQIRFEIKQGHCDQFFDQEVVDNVELDAEDKGSETEEYEEKEYEDIREKNEDNNYITRNEDSNEFENKLDENTNSSNIEKGDTAKESKMYNHSTIIPTNGHSHTVLFSSVLGGISFFILMVFVLVSVHKRRKKEKEAGEKI